jgi:uncharacterized protein YecT (DUF1311 family)
MMKRVLTVVMVGLCLLSVKASSRRQSVGEPPCGKHGTQAEANACSRLDYEKAEAEMRGVYRRLTHELAGRAGEGRRKLEKAQSLWLRYRKANCESEASIYEGGSIRPAVYNACLAGITRERTSRLREFLFEIGQ